MSVEAAPRGPLDDALLALRLFLMAPHRLGGISLRGAGPARDLLAERLRSEDVGMRRLPSHADDERLLGGVDIAASLAAGSTMRQRGLLAEAAGGILLVPLAERMSEATAGKLAQAMDSVTATEPLALVLLDDGLEADDLPPACLMERIAFHCDLSRVESLDSAKIEDTCAVSLADIEALNDEQLSSLAMTSIALGIASARALIFASETARLHAAFHGRSTIENTDIEAAARLVLAARATQLPSLEQEPEEPQIEQEAEADGSGEDPEPGERLLEDVVLEAAAAAIPADLLAQLSAGKAKRHAQGSGGGKRRKSAFRGKPLGARPGVPRNGARLALIDSLRAAVPWQEFRKRQSGSDRPLILLKEDLRVRRFEERAAKLTIFCVDASGSAAASRLAEAKGAVELMLAQAYATRSEVALVAFRGTSAELILPPTRSLTRARRALSELPGGGGTPLALGLQAAHEIAVGAENRGRTPQIVVLTDGRANIAADGSASRSKAAQDVEIAAKSIGAKGIDAIVVDISARSGPDGLRLAQLMQARFLALPMADAHKLHQAVTAASPARAA